VCYFLAWLNPNRRSKIIMLKQTGASTVMKHMFINLELSAGAEQHDISLPIDNIDNVHALAENKEIEELKEMLHKYGHGAQLLLYIAKMDEKIEIPYGYSYGYHIIIESRLLEDNVWKKDMIENMFFVHFMGQHNVNAPTTQYNIVCLLYMYTNMKDMEPYF
ncbi:hypothetical protein ACJX0J_028723, partial [Zea mays]